MKKDSKQCCYNTTLESIHTKDESKRGSAFAFIFGVTSAVNVTELQVSWNSCIVKSKNYKTFEKGPEHISNGRIYVNIVIN